MKTPKTANTSTFPFDLHWTSHDLADAVPLRLSEIPVFRMDDHAAASANAASLRCVRGRTSFLPGTSTERSALPVFRIR